MDTLDHAPDENSKSKVLSLIGKVQEQSDERLKQRNQKLESALNDVRQASPSCAIIAWMHPEDESMNVRLMISPETGWEVYGIIRAIQGAVDHEIFSGDETRETK
jgi:hypothetical protein